MKINMPVTNHEVKLREGEELVTTTDLKGIITSVNPAFIEISGFSESELVGKNHNVVRHPDMPAAAFQDLWDTLKLGRPWTKMVKNRCKNGDHYWVKANVTPVYKHGQIVEYMSVRTRPNEDEISKADALYAQLGSGQASLPSPERIKPTGLMKDVSRVAIGSAVLTALLMVILGFTAGAGWMSIGPLLGFICLLAGSIHIVKNKVCTPLAQVKTLLRTVAEGDYHSYIDVEIPGEIGELNRAVKSLAIKLGFEVNNAKEEAQRSVRVNEALDNVTSNVMLADPNMNIIYMNKSVLAMLKNAEEDIKADLPNFNADQLIGENVDVFHKNPSHQRQMVTTLKDTYKTTIKVGVRSFNLVANPVVNEHGERLGTVVEWADITNQLYAEQQIENLIVQASQGQLDNRLNESEYDGFQRNVAEGINSMLNAIVEPLKEVRSVLDSLAEGDLTKEMNGDFHGEFSELNDVLNQSMGKLREMTSEILSAGASITTGASEISRGNTTLSQRTEAQAASLEETAASMEEMTSTVRQNSQNAMEANDLANNAKKLAEGGGEISAKVVNSMGEISQSSSRIAEIIGVIDEIAFQTNLLALNAAVEAARAGEQGRGFAVVASEVRNLAQRSASAAKEIKELISDSVEKVEEGARYVDESGAALGEIMAAVEKVSVIISEIASAGQEQATGIDQVNSAVSQMDEGTQQNAALVEQVAAASQSMEEQAHQLQRLVNFFKIDDRPSVAASPKVASAPSPAATTRPVAAPQPAPVKSPSTQTAVADEWEEF